MSTLQVKDFFKVYGVIAAIVGVILTCGAFYTTVNLRIEEHSKSLIALQLQNKDEELNIIKLDKESAKIDIKLTNIEVTLIEIKQSLKNK